MQKEWYVVNTYSGHENKVKEKLEMRASTMGLEDYIFRVIVPEQKEIEYKMAIGKFEVPKCTILEELLEEYVKIYGHDKWGVSTYAGNISLINNYILPTIGKVKLSSINTHFMEKYYKDLLEMPAVKSSKNMDGSGTITESTVNEIHKILRSAFRQAVKWDLMEKNPAVDATVPKAKTQEREIWTAEMLMQALEACDNKMLKIAFHLAFTATLRIGELLGLTWDEMDISEEAIANNRAYVIISKQVERVSRDAVEALNSKEIILIFPTSKKKQNSQGFENTKDRQQYSQSIHSKICCTVSGGIESGTG